MGTATVFRSRTGPATLRPMQTVMLSATLVVRDLPAVERFYTGLLGLRVHRREGGAVALGADGPAFLHLRHDPRALPDDPGAAGLFHLAFLLPSRAALGGWLRHAGDAGQRMDGAADHLVSEAAYLRDPEGNGVEVYADRPPSLWAWDADGVRMANNPLDRAGLRAAATDWAGAPDGTRLGHVHLRVGDVDAGVQFCAARLGLAVTRRWPGVAFLSWAGYHHHIAVNTWATAGAPPRAPGMSGLECVTAQGPAGIVPATDAALATPWGVPIHAIPQPDGAA